MAVEGQGSPPMWEQQGRRGWGEGLYVPGAVRGFCQHELTSVSPTPLEADTPLPLCMAVTE